uniref:Keratin 51 n=1 Tax=Xenopus tropicalis TaxID=8364 RepID=A0A803JYA1_XENTR
MSYSSVKGGGSGKGGYSIESGFNSIRCQLCAARGCNWCCTNCPSVSNVFAGQGGGLGGGFGRGFGGGSGGGFGARYGGGFGGGSGSGFGAGYGGGFGGGSGGGFGGGAKVAYEVTGTGGQYGSSVFGNKKETMQNLNDRLANYLDKVNALEAANAELERKIKEWYDKQPTTSDGGKDYNKYYSLINELNQKILNAALDNAELALHCENAKLAAEDFRLKYESEWTLSQAVVSDINGLRKLMDDLTLSKSSLESQIESLSEELAYLNKTHDEEIKGTQNTKLSQVSVEMKAQPGTDLTKILNDMRAQHEALAQKNRREAEDRYNKMSAELRQQISAGVGQVQTSKTETSELKKTLQALEIELQAQIAKKQSLELMLAETEGIYCMKLSRIQVTISSIEEHLAQLKADSESQHSQYQQLLGIKTRLEQEIETYRRLLDGEGSKQTRDQGQGRGSGSERNSSVDKDVAGLGSIDSGGGRTIRIKKTVENILDGKVVSMEEGVQKL